MYKHRFPLLLKLPIDGHAIGTDICALKHFDTMRYDSRV